MNWNVKTVLLPLCAAAFTVMAAGNANAVPSTPEVESFNFSGFNFAPSGIPGPGSAILSFDLFDAALGTLNGVSITIDAVIGARLSIDGAEGVPVSGQSSHDVFVDSTALGASSVNVFTDSLSTTCFEATEPSGCASEVDNGAGAPLNGNLFTLLGGGATLANFVGAGTFDIELIAESDLLQCDGEGAANNFFQCRVRTLAAGDITVTYDFEPAVVDPNRVPEPAALGLLGLGVLGLGALSRRRRKAGADA